MEHAVNHLKQADPVLAGIIERVGRCQLRYRDPGFETLVRSIVFQQLNGKAARTIYERLAAQCSAACNPQAGAADPAPAITPQAILKLRTPALRQAGLSRQKIAYLRDLAGLTATGKLDFAALPGLSDDEVIEKLTQVKGVGVWTAHMFLMFALRRENILPTGDLGVRLAIRKAYGKKSLPKPRTIERIARPWHPYCSIATWYLWRSVDGQAM